MQYRQLGRSGVRVSALCLGTMNFGASTDEETSLRIVGQALEAGINFIDTADVYGRGVSEEIVGKGIERSGRRDDIVLATKAVAHMGKGPNDHGAGRYHLIRACEASLRRLKTDRIDLYQLHIVDLSTPLDEVLETLDILVRQGKILYTGTSKWPPTLIMEALGISDRCGLPRFITEQPPYNMVDRCVEKELVWMCIRQGIGIIPWGPLAYGILTGTYRKGQPFPEGHRFSKAAADNNRITPAALEVVEQLLPLAEAHGGLRHPRPTHRRPPDAGPGVAGDRPHRRGPRRDRPHRAPGHMGQRLLPRQRLRTPHRRPIPATVALPAQDLWSSAAHPRSLSAPAAGTPWTVSTAARQRLPGLSPEQPEDRSGPMVAHRKGVDIGR